MKWFPDWSGQRAIVLGSGPSAQEAPLHLAIGKAKIIAVNNSWLLAPWADVLYASDWEWWRDNDTSGFEGLKICRSPYEGVNVVMLQRRGQYRYVDDILMDELGVIGAGGSSGFQALNLALQFGARQIALVGIDASIDRGVHWHPDHIGARGNPTAATAKIWKAHFDRQAPLLKRMGAEVFNCSEVSALQAYPKMALGTWLER